MGVAHIPHTWRSSTTPGRGLHPRVRRGRHRPGVGPRPAAHRRGHQDGRDRRADRGLRGGPRRGAGPRAAVRRLPGRAPRRGSALPLAEERDLPTGEEIGAEFERFLAGLVVDRPTSSSRRAQIRRRARPSSSTSRPSTSTCSAASSPTRSCSGSSAARSPRRRWSRARAPWTTRSSCTPCTATSCGPATPRCRSCTTSSGSATDGPSRPAASRPASTAGPIYYMTASFQIPEEGFRAPGRDAGQPSPGELQDMGEVFRARSPESADSGCASGPRSSCAGWGTPATAGTSRTTSGRRSRGCGSASTATSATTGCCTRRR